MAAGNTPEPEWRLPPGVTRGLWEYVHNDHVADDYDDYFAHCRLFDFDAQVIQRWFDKPGGVVADLGCGTGRALIPLVRRGFRGLAVDLSEPMLRIVNGKAAAEDLPVQCVKANLTQLDCIAEDSCDYAICLFSTLGMIRGFDNRMLALKHVRRIIRPGGRFVLHIHNLYYNIYDPYGPWWFLKTYFQKYGGEVEPGDKWFNYRGVTNMFLHVFTPRELRRALGGAGFRIREILPLHSSRVRSLRFPWLFSTLRANGWIIVCE